VSTPKPRDTPADCSGAISQVCPSCRSPSPQIYVEGWICHNHDCRQFWLLHTDVGLFPIPPGFSLTYTPTWLSPVPAPAHLRTLPYDVCPPQPGPGFSQIESSPGDRTLWKGELPAGSASISESLGWVCPYCRRANCRFRWEVWVCRRARLSLKLRNAYHAVTSMRRLTR
jgi:hypothetical protein